jgi:hypothetical protein
VLPEDKSARGSRENVMVWIGRTARGRMPGVPSRDLFTPVIDESALNPLFKFVATWKGYAPARAMMNEVFSTLDDADANFLEDFQGRGFAARVWELYLDATFREMQLDPRRLDRPDFRLRREYRDVYVEAVTSNPSAGTIKPPESSTTGDREREHLEMVRDDYIAIKLGSPLFSKLQKEYWEIKEVGRWPLVFAIEAFHDDSALSFSGTALARYLYGIRVAPVLDDAGQLVGVETLAIEKHEYGPKSIPSGFFFQPHGDRVSAVLFSNSGTTTKFNRMGWLAGHHIPDAMFARFGLAWNRDPCAAMPTRFQYHVGDPRFPEDWKQGLEVFHNPVAREPLSRTFFHGLVQHRLDEFGRVVSWGGPAFHPLSSKTIMIVTTDDEIDKRVQT